MIIKEKNNESRTLRFTKNFFASMKRRNKVILFVACFVVYSSAIFLFGVTTPVEKRNLDGLMNFTKRDGDGENKFDPNISKPEHLEIAISDKDYEKIVKERKKALDAGVLITDADSYVPAKIRHRGKVYRAKIRLKGDWIEHIQGDKWSFRVSVRDGETLFGMEDFSMQDPARRNFMHGWFFHKLLKSEDIIGLRVNLVEVTLNNKKKGIYYLEEHFDKILIENNEYREGPIIKFDEDLMWLNRKELSSIVEDERGAYYSSVIDTFKAKRIASDPKLKVQFKEAYNLLFRFRSGALSAKYVFDLKKLARYYAISDLLGAYHMAFFHWLLDQV